MGVWMLSAEFFRKRRLRTMLAIICVLTALAHLLLALGNSVWLYVLAFTLASFLNASMMPATNTMIALNVGRERRGLPSASPAPRRRSHSWSVRWARRCCDDLAQIRVCHRQHPAARSGGAGCLRRCVSR
jgi:hypothetical protein